MTAALLLAFALAHDVVAPPRVEPPSPPAQIDPSGLPTGVDGGPAAEPALPVVNEPPAAPPADFSTAEMLMPFAKTMLMLCVVLAIVWLTLHKGVGKLVEKAQSGRRVRVVERISLDARRTLYLVEVDGRNLLLAGGEGGVVLLTDVAGTPGVSGKSDFSTVLNARAAASSTTTSDAVREAT